MPQHSNQKSIEFYRSLRKPAITSGRDANCFFQSFMHVFTHLPKETHAKLLADERYKMVIQCLVENFNQAYNRMLPKPLNFQQIIALSKQLHPLDREHVFGSVLRATYNTLVKKGVISTPLLGLGSDVIVEAPQMFAFANCLGAYLNVYMTQKEFNKSSIPDDVAKSIKANAMTVDDEVWVCDSRKEQPQVWELNIVYAGIHLNYTRGTIELNQKERDKVAIFISEHDAEFAGDPSNKMAASLFTASSPEIFSKRAAMLYRQIFTAPNSTDLIMKQSELFNENKNDSQMAASSAVPNHQSLRARL